MPTIAEILEKQGMKSEPYKNCAAGKIPFTRTLMKECYLPCHELEPNEARKISEELQTHVLQKGFGDICAECRDRISSGNVVIRFNKF